MADDLKFDLLARDRMTEVFDRVAKATEKLDSQLEKLGKQSTKTGKELDDAEKGTRKLGDGMDDAGKKSAGFRDKLGAGLSGAMDKLKGFAIGGAVAAAAAGVAIGTALGSKVMDAAKDAMQRQQDTAKAMAQIGASPEQAQEYGRIAGRLYSHGFGEGYADNINAIKQILRDGVVFEDEDSSSIERIAGKVQTLANLMETDLSDVTRATGQLMRTQLAGSADEALDVITRGMQQGADKAGDLLDTLNEYPTQFRDLGLDAKTAMGILVQGLRAGARDSDIVADSLKELNIRVKDGTAADALKKLGLNAHQMAEAFNKGGPQAAAALDKIFDKLRAVKDPAERFALAQKLMGSQAEDLAGALEAIDPSRAVGALGEVEGAAQKAGDAMGNTAAAKIEKLKRTLETWATDTIGSKVIPMVDKLIDVGKRIYEAFKETGLGDDFARIWSSFSKEGGQETLDGLDGLVATIRDNKDEIRQFGDMAFAVFAVLANGAIPATVRGFELLVQAIGTGMRAMNFFRDVAFAVFDAYLSAAVHAMGWIPGLGDKLRQSQADFRQWRDHVNDAIDGIKRDVTVRIRAHITTSYSGGASSGSHGLYVAAYASGGQAPGGVPIRVGEHGAETVVLPPGGGHVMTHGETTGLDGGGDTEMLQPLVLTLDGEKVWQGLLRYKRRTGKLSLGLA